MSTTRQTLTSVKSHNMATHDSTGSRCPLAALGGYFSPRGCTGRRSFWSRLLLLHIAFALVGGFFLRACAGACPFVPEYGFCYLEPALACLLVLLLLLAACSAPLCLLATLYLAHCFMVVASGHAEVRPVATSPGVWELAGDWVLIILSALALFAIVARAWVLSARRLRDSGQKAGRLFFFAVPLLGWLAAPFFLCQPAPPAPPAPEA